jgi:4-hydroxy-2-oxoheptanedioate aldolase
MLFFGPGDYSHALGIPGEFDDPRITEARKRVAEAAIRHGKFAGTVGGVAAIKGLVEQGYRFISTGADVVGLGNYFTDIASAFNKTTPKQKAEGVYR